MCKNSKARRPSSRAVTNLSSISHGSSGKRSAFDCGLKASNLCDEWIVFLHHWGSTSTQLQFIIPIEIFRFQSIKVLRHDLSLLNIYNFIQETMM